MVRLRPGASPSVTLGCIAISTFTSVVSAHPLDGRALFFAERKGNCTACHKTPTDALQKGVSSIGPPLESIKQKFPLPVGRARLRDAIWDLSKVSPKTVMPPYGKHRILKETEIDAIVNFLETL